MFDHRRFPANATPEADGPSAEGNTPIPQLHVDITDDLSGVNRVEIILDGKPVADGDAIDLTTLAFGPHTLPVGAEDTAGNVANAEVTFTVVAALDSLAGSVARFTAGGDIDPRLEQSLLAKPWSCTPPPGCLTELQAHAAKPD